MDANELGELLAMDIPVTVPVESSWIDSATWYKQTEILEIDCKNGSHYQFPCDRETFLEFVAAPSKGSFVRTHWR